MGEVPVGLDFTDQRYQAFVDVGLGKKVHLKELIEPTHTATIVADPQGGVYYDMHPGAKRR